MKAYVMFQEEKDLLEHVKRALYDPKALTGDQRRDCAHQIAYILENLTETDSL